MMIYKTIIILIKKINPKIIKIKINLYNYQLLHLKKIDIYLSNFYI